MVIVSYEPQANEELVTSKETIGPIASVMNTSQEALQEASFVVVGDNGDLQGTLSPKPILTSNDSDMRVLKSQHWKPVKMNRQSQWRVSMGDEGEMIVVGSNSNAVSSPGKLRSIKLSQSLISSQQLNLPTTRKRSTIETRRKTETA